MCGVSGIEFLVILVVAVIVLGPDRLPEAMRTLGKMARELRKITDDFSDVRDDFTREFREEFEKDEGQQKALAKQSAQRRAKAGRAGEDVPDIDKIRAQRAAAQAEDSPDAHALPSAEDAADNTPPPSTEEGRPLPTLKPAAGAVESGQDTRTTSAASALETDTPDPAAAPKERSLPPHAAPPTPSADPDAGDAS